METLTAAVSLTTLVIVCWTLGDGVNEVDFPVEQTSRKESSQLGTVTVSKQLFRWTLNRVAYVLALLGLSRCALGQDTSISQCVSGTENQQCCELSVLPKTGWPRRWTNIQKGVETLIIATCSWNRTGPAWWAAKFRHRLCRHEWLRCVCMWEERKINKHMQPK